MYRCPVCAFKGMQDPPSDYNICPCCGTEFGYDDFSSDHRDLRNEWLSRGALWWSEDEPPPQGWSPGIQLLEAGVGFVLNSPSWNTQERVIYNSPLVSLIVPSSPGTHSEEVAI